MTLVIVNMHWHWILWQPFYDSESDTVFLSIHLALRFVNDWTILRHSIFHQILNHSIPQVQSWLYIHPSYTLHTGGRYSVLLLKPCEHHVRVIHIGVSPFPDSVACKKSSCPTNAVHIRTIASCIFNIFLGHVFSVWAVFKYLKKAGPPANKGPKFQLQSQTSISSPNYCIQRLCVLSAASSPSLSGKPDFHFSVADGFQGILFPSSAND